MMLFSCVIVVAIQYLPASSNQLTSCLMCNNLLCVGAYCSRVVSSLINSVCVYHLFVHWIGLHIIIKLMLFSCVKVVTTQCVRACQ